MTGSITQVDLEADDSGPPDTFVQIRFTEGETPSGTIEIYEPKSANSIELSPGNTLPVTGSPAFTEGGFDYYNIEAPTDIFSGGPSNVFAVAYVDDNGVPQSTLVFGNSGGPGADKIDFSGGALDGSSLTDVLNDPSTIGGDKQSGEGPFAVGPDGTVTSGPSNPDSPVCFAAGTLIATPDGERPVETLEAGTPVVTADGRTVPVKWIGHQTLHKLFTPEERFRPVRIKAGALGHASPRMDLVVTGDHGILIDGVMVNAGALVNGTTIVREPKSQLSERVTYWHVETEHHDVILACGTAAETFVDATTRRSFDNYGEFVALFGEPEGNTPVLPYPRAFGKRQVPPQIRARIEARSENLGCSLSAAS